MGNYGCKMVLKILAGALLIAGNLGYLGAPQFEMPWLIVGLYLLLAGIAPLVCKCDCCAMKAGKKK